MFKVLLFVSKQKFLKATLCCYQTDNMTTKKQRARGENWLDQDKHLLTALIRKRVSFIEDKNTDTNTNTKKMKAWEDILSRFNIMCRGGKRTVKQLKSQWGVIKMQQKKTVELNEIVTDETSKNTSNVSTWLQKDFIIGNNEFDSDQKNQIKDRESSPDADDIVIIDQEEEIRQEVPPSESYEKKTKTTCNSINTDTEIESSDELHKLQIENERRKSKNLLLEELLIRKKIEYYETKTKLLWQ